MQSSITNNTDSGLDSKAKEVSVKFSSEDWKAAEKKLSVFDQKVKDELCELANSLVGINNVGKADDAMYKTIGNDFYKLIRNDLFVNKLVKEKVESLSKKAKEKPMKAADKIRQQNTMRIIETELTKIIKGFDYTDFRIPTGLGSKIIEMRAIGFMQAGNFLIQNKKIYLDSNKIIKKTKIPFVYNIIIAMEKFLTAVTGIEGQSIINASTRCEISSHLLDDYKLILDEVKTVYNFNGMVAYENAPQLLFYTDFDSYIPNKGFKPYMHQKEITEGIKNAILNKTPTVFSYKAMTGNGKTVSVVSIAKMIMNLKMMYKSHESMELLFCCNLRSVKEQAAQWLFNSDIPFAIGAIDGDRGLRIINNYNCKSDDKRVAIVCSPEACYEIINGDSFKKYILFLDEPTIGADMKTSAAKMNVRLMSNLPEISILSSATLPHEIYPWIKDNHEIKYGPSEFVTIYSNKIHIGCEVKTFDGELVVPHLKSKNSKDLLTAIERISEIPFLGRAYTINVVKNIYELMRSENIEGLPDIPTLFKQIENLNTDTVREFAMTLLKLLATQPNKVIQRVCQTKIQSDTTKTITIEKTRSDQEDDDFEWEEEPVQEVTNTVEFDKLGTTGGHKFMRQNLIATVNPVEFAYKNFKPLLDDVLAEIGSLRKIQQQVSQQVAIWQKQVDRIDKQEFVNELERAKETEELLTSKPTLQFPAKFQINTKEHVRHYAKKTNLAIDRTALRHEIVPSEIPFDTMAVQDELALLLMCGVGVYTPSFNLNQVYLATVLRYAEEGKLAYLISDASISYGTNYPINRVFITTDFSDKYSINTIFQLMSRAGRVGKSWIAEAYIDNECALRIINTTTSTEEDIETKNINQLYEDVVLENIAKDEKLIEELEKKKREEEERILKAEQERLRKIEEEKRATEAAARAREEARSIRSVRRIATVSAVVAEAPGRVSIENNFRRESSGQVTRRNPQQQPQTRSQRIANIGAKSS